MSVSVKCAVGDCGGCVTCGSGPAHASGVPISMARVGEKGTVIRISGKDETKRFLAGLGFVAGAMVSTVCRADGNMIVDVKGSKIAIDKHLASKILFCPEG